MNMKRLKRSLTGLLVLVLAISLFGACGQNNETGSNTTPTPTVTVKPTDAGAEPTAKPTDAGTEPTAEPTDAETEPTNIEVKPTVEPTTEQADGKYGMREGMTSLEVVADMGNGINLGNTMEAFGRGTYGTTGAPSEYETFWGQPITTQESIAGMKEAGFDTLRIPVAWTNAMAFETGDYTIGADYLARVEEIINYALDEGMYVVVNDHWDGSWWGMFGSATQETRDQAMELFVSMWQQLSEAFAEYGDHLIFEAANEELGNRLNDVDVAADSGALSVDECYEMTTKITQAFVDTVRATGGNNAERFLLIPGYDTDIARTCDDRYVMPTDTVENRLLLSVHYYEPWGYCGNESLASWGDVKDYTDQNERLAMMTKFTEQGYGIVIGEYAVALNADGTTKENICDFFNNFLDNCDLYGYCPLLWDCSTLYDRTACEMKFEEPAEVFRSRSKAAQAELTEEEIKEAAQLNMEAALAAAPESSAGTDKAIAWLMMNSGDWTQMYSVGDIYDPEDKTVGLVATDVEITGAGTYTVGLDFSGTSVGSCTGTAFAALAISNGEVLFPNYCVSIDKILVDGEPCARKGRAYTTSDDGVCTRVNLYNGWVTEAPPEARTPEGTRAGISPIIIDSDSLGTFQTIEITFTYKLP